ncbi:MAG: DUF697 domain-containing protein [Candidatus Electrothrix sp. AW1]|nr:DUF697 domain-containing protein [Candidatus Electrothrix sp. AX1]MCI5181410.1 DUF697 domain-containing protein [Candidatus Electrothrix gigas]
MVAEQNNTATQDDQAAQCECDATTACCSSSDAKEKGERVIRNHMLTAMGVGLIPFPLVDLVSITGVQLNMLRRLSNTYEVPFTEHKVKNILMSLVGGSSVLPLGGTLISLTKFIPVAGQALGAVSMPITAGAVTYAVGKVFHQHFASGGTFLTFDPDKVREYYKQMLKEGKALASKAKPSASAAS